MSDKVILRDYTPDDAGMVSSHWRNSFYYGSLDPISTPKDLWFRASKEYVRESLENDTIDIACLESDPDFIVGFSVFKVCVLQFIYVKSRYRKQGIGRLLLSKRKIAGVNPHNLTKIGKNLILKLKIGVKQ